MARIELRDLNKSFGSVRAVKDLNITIEDGEFVVFVGPSGCGKTTTLRMIAGFEDPTSGEIRIDGRIVNDLEPRDRGLGMSSKVTHFFRIRASRRTSSSGCG